MAERIICLIGRLKLSQLKSKSSLTIVTLQQTVTLKKFLQSLRLFVHNCGIFLIDALLYQLWSSQERKALFYHYIF